MHLHGALYRCGDPFWKNILNTFKTMVKKPWLAVFIVTCALGLAVVLDLFQLHVHSDILCLCTLPTEPSPEGLQLGSSRLCRGVGILKFDKKSTELKCFISMIYSASYFKNWKFVWGSKPRGDRTGEQQTSISKTVLPNHAKDIGLILMLSGDYNFLPSTVSWTTLFSGSITKLYNLTYHLPLR